MKAGELYYNPKTNEIIEIVSGEEYPIVERVNSVRVIEVYDGIYSIKIDNTSYKYPSGPLFGKLVHVIKKDFRKIGTV